MKKQRISQETYLYSSFVPVLVVGGLLLVAALVAKTSLDQKYGTKVLGDTSNQLAEAGSDSGGGLMVGATGVAVTGREDMSSPEPTETDQPEVRTRSEVETRTTERESTGGGELGKNEPLEVKSEDGKKTMTLETARVHFQLENSGDQLQIQAEQQNGVKTALSSETLNQINNGLKGNDLEVATTAGGFLLKNGQVQAETHFPLSVNLSTNSLTVTTPAGAKTVTVLPAAAVQNLMTKNIINRLAVGTTGQSVPLQLVDQNGQTVFVIDGMSEKKLFGLFPISLPKTVTVSAENGQVVGSSISPLARILELLSV